MLAYLLWKKLLTPKPKEGWIRHYANTNFWLGNPFDVYVEINGNVEEVYLPLQSG